MPTKFVVSFFNGAKVESFEVMAHAPNFAIDIAREEHKIPRNLCPRAMVEAEGHKTLYQHDDGSFRTEKWQ